MRTLVRFIVTAVLAYGLLLLTAYYADAHPRFASAVGGHNVVLEVFISLPLIYYLLGLLHPFRRFDSDSH